MSQRVAVAIRAAAVAGAAMLALGLASCGGGGSDDPVGASPRTRTDLADARPTSTTHPGRHAHTRSTPTSGDTDDGPSTPPPGAAEMGESLRFGELEVRAVDYREDGYQGAATGTRVDILTVEECASSGSATVTHQTWRLVDADGRTLGAAGGKMVNGHPTEDLPQTLAAGQCLTTMLAIGVPAGSIAVAVRDGPDDTWVLAD